MATIQEIARYFTEMFIQSERVNGDKFWKTIDDRPEELTELIYAAHGDMLPDDWKYAFVREALIDFSEAEDPDDVQPEADIYTNDLTAWLHSRADRYYYCDQYQEDFGVKANTSMSDRLSGGQYMEKREVYYSVLSSLRDLEESGYLDSEEEEEEE